MQKNELPLNAADYDLNALSLTTDEPTAQHDCDKGSTVITMNNAPSSLQAITSTPDIQKDYEDNLEQMKAEAKYLLQNSSLIQSGQATATITMKQSIKTTTVATIEKGKDGNAGITFTQEASITPPRIKIGMDLK